MLLTYKRSGQECTCDLPLDEATQLLGHEHPAVKEAKLMQANWLKLKIADLETELKELYGRLKSTGAQS